MFKLETVAGLWREVNLLISASCDQWRKGRKEGRREGGKEGGKERKGGRFPGTEVADPVGRSGIENAHPKWMKGTIWNERLIKAKARLRSCTHKHVGLV